MAEFVYLYNKCHISTDQGRKDGMRTDGELTDRIRDLSKCGGDICFNKYLEDLGVGTYLQMIGKNPAYISLKPPSRASLVKPDTRPEAYLGFETRRIRVASRGVRRTSANTLREELKLKRKLEEEMVHTLRPKRRLGR